MVPKAVLRGAAVWACVVLIMSVEASDSDDDGVSPGGFLSSFFGFSTTETFIRENHVLVSSVGGTENDVSAGVADVGISTGGLAVTFIESNDDGGPSGDGDEDEGVENELAAGAAGINIGGPGVNVD